LSISQTTIDIRQSGKGPSMKYVTAIFKPSRLDAVLDAVTAAGASGVTVTEVRGYGRQQGKTEVYRGAEYEVRLLPKVRIEIAATDETVEKIVDAIVASANTSKIGDGKIFVMDLEAVTRIRTGEKNESALTS
jgi:nitrogen regulatory protein P-II 2